ncbi:CAP domain-containing protein [Massilia sp. PAMC28688]|nr:CAP domain-containing protein [Massilia sp. PAMC28688]
MTGNVATDGLNWLNFRRQQAGLSVLPRNALIDSAAEGHSNYQRLNEVTHVQEVGKPGFTGVSLFDRLQRAGYANPTNYFYGEVISASTSTSGVYLAEELITAIYHRFAIFEPRFKEIGAGALADSRGYNVLTINFGANNGYGPGLGAGNVVTWPIDGHTNVLRDFNSDNEAPDPVPNQNRVGYPISVHADADARLTVASFTMRPRGGADIATRLLSADADSVNTKTRSAVSIVPLAVLSPSTTYDVAFVGTLNGLPLTKSWSFTTRQ